MYPTGPQKNNLHNDNNRASDFFFHLPLTLPKHTTHIYTTTPDPSQQKNNLHNNNTNKTLGLLLILHRICTACNDLLKHCSEVEVNSQLALDSGILCSKCVVKEHKGFDVSDRTVRIVLILLLLLFISETFLSNLFENFSTDLPPSRHPRSRRIALNPLRRHPRPPPPRRPHFELVSVHEFWPKF